MRTEGQLLPQDSVEFTITVRCENIITYIPNLRQANLYCKLNTSVTKVLLLLLVPKGGGGSPRDLTTENHFPSRILQWNLHHICMDYYRKSQFCKKKKNWKCCTVWKWRPNNQFLFRVISILAKIWKTSFPKEFFNEIWLKVGEHEYIYITEITFRKKD